MVYPLVGALTAACMISLAVLTTGRAPNLIAAVSLLLVGIGAGLIVARFGRLGPFDGRLGAPWFESHLRDTLFRESARAARFQRELSILAVRQTSAGALSWRTLTRPTDEAFHCRNGWTVIMLPETTGEQALTLLRRATVDHPEMVQAILLSPNAFGWNGEALGHALTELATTEQHCGAVLVNRSGNAEVVPLAL